MRSDHHLDPNTITTYAAGIVRPMDTAPVPQSIIGIERFGLSFEEHRKIENRLTMFWTTVAMIVVGSGLMIGTITLIEHFRFIGR